MSEGLTICYTHEWAEHERIDAQEAREEREAQDEAKYGRPQTWRWQRIPNGTRVQEYDDSYCPELGIFPELGDFGTVLYWGWDGSGPEPMYFVRRDNGGAVQLPDGAIRALALVA